MKRIFSVMIIAVLMLSFCLMSASATTGPAGYVGDADLNHVIDINDATYIQRCVAKLEYAQPTNFIFGDVDVDRMLTICDATNIQRFIAKLETDTMIDTWYNYDMYEDDFYSDYQSGSALKGVPVTFTANVRAGSPMQSYELYVNDELVASSQDNNSLTYTFEDAGVYRVKMVASAFFSSGYFEEADFVVTDDVSDELKVKTLYSTGKYWGTYAWGMPGMKFYAEGMGGTAPYQYEFVLTHPENPSFSDSPNKVYIQEYSDQNYYELPQYNLEDIFGRDAFYGSLPCELTVRIKDASGSVVEQSVEFYYEDHPIG